MKCLINSPTGFDLFELASLAADQGFDGIQLYLNNDLAAGVELLEEWCGTLKETGLLLAVHLPSETVTATLTALDRIAQPDTAVIGHYPDQQIVPRTGRAAWEFSPFGTPADGYHAWLDHCRSAGAIPVFDLPRLFKNTDERDAGRFADHLFTRLAGVRYILHLIDCPTAEQQQDQWCAMGQGQVGHYLERSVIPLPELVVLEHESLIQAVNSLPWLRKLARGLGL